MCCNNCLAFSQAASLQIAVHRIYTHVGHAAAVLRLQETHGSTRGGISSSVMMAACCTGRWLLRGGHTPERVVQECKGLVQPGQHQPHEPPWLHSHRDLYQLLRQPPLQAVQGAIQSCEGYQTARQAVCA